MQASNAPIKSAVPFAESGTKNIIPVASQIGVTPGAASFIDGFPPLTMTPLAAGGVPPYGADFNGILNFLSAAVRWAQAGGRYTFDVSFVADVGGYPKGSILAAASGNGSWLNLVDNNTTNPDAGGANWISLGAGIASVAQAQALTDDTTLLTPKKLADALKGANQSLIANGFQKFPGGLILQWLTAPQTVNAAVTATFPLAFPNACLKVFACESNSSEWFTNNLTVYGLYSPTKTTVGITGYRWNGSGYVAYTGAIANVIAIGY